MRSYIALIFVACCLILPACGDNDDGPPGDGGLDQSLHDGPAVTEGRMDGPTQEDAPQVEDGAPTETTPTEGGVEETSPDGPLADAVPADGPMTEAMVGDGPPPSDAMPADGPMTEAMVGDGPPPSDATPADGPYADVPIPDTMVDLPLLDTTADLPLLDTTVDLPPDTTVDLPPDTTVDLPQGDAPIGLNDAGQFMCMGIGGPMICECNDTVDNDADGNTDYPDDPDCLSESDNSEIGGDTECSDGVDNDGDGDIDARDNECTGYLDNDESGFGTKIPGDNVPCSEDCFFDGDSGPGNDGCTWNITCDPLSPGSWSKNVLGKCDYDAGSSSDPECDPDYPQSTECLDLCLPITPNGCDCFGCCQVTVGGVTKIIKLNAKCTEEVFDDPEKCPSCTQVTACFNDCGPCEICIGKPAPDPSCFPTDDAGVPIDGGIPSLCDPEDIPCPTGNECPSGFWCVTGCCQQIPS